VRGFPTSAPPCIGSSRTGPPMGPAHFGVGLTWCRPYRAKSESASLGLSSDSAKTRWTRAEEAQLPSRGWGPSGSHAQTSKPCHARRRALTPLRPGSEGGTPEAWLPHWFSRAPPACLGGWSKRQVLPHLLFNPTWHGECCRGERALFVMAPRLVGAFSFAVVALGLFPASCRRVRHASERCRERARESPER
jgi:hypothetical protein